MRIEGELATAIDWWLNSIWPIRLREYDSPEEGEELEIWATLVEKYEDSVPKLTLGMIRRAHEVLGLPLELLVQPYELRRS